jgi:hypothetical protein
VGYHLREVEEDGGLPRGVNISYSGGGVFHMLVSRRVLSSLGVKYGGLPRGVNISNSGRGEFCMLVS